MLIIFEGIDGSGKTTNCDITARHLETHGYQTIVSHTRSDYYIGAVVREVSREGIALAPDVRFLMIAADYLYRLRKEILPALQEKKIVIVDRYKFSSLAYNRACDIDSVWSTRVLSPLPEPDLAILLDGDPVVCRDRILRQRALTIYEDDLDVQRSVRQKLLGIANANPIFRVIDANSPLAKVSEQVIEAVMGLIGNQGYEPSAER